MTFLLNAAELKEAELRLYWQLGEMYTRLLRDDPSSPVLDELRDEFDTMSQMTDWPYLREACMRTVRRIDETRTSRKVGVA